mmetsp:Transcript_116730/g.330209  ORF Transcript_116730/g.330209 Transcript_116730/m.330209 type:complete len:224 (+) Transcript_116730:188-859(+)
MWGADLFEVWRLRCLLLRLRCGRQCRRDVIDQGKLPWRRLCRCRRGVAALAQDVPRESGVLDAVIASALPRAALCGLWRLRLRRRGGPLAHAGQRDGRPSATAGAARVQPWVVPLLPTVRGNAHCVDVAGLVLARAPMPTEMALHCLVGLPLEVVRRAARADVCLRVVLVQRAQTGGGIAGPTSHLQRRDEGLGGLAGATADVTAGRVGRKAAGASIGGPRLA